MSIGLPHLGELEGAGGAGGAGGVICCPKLHSSLTFSHLADNREPHIFHTSIVNTEPIVRC